MICTNILLYLLYVSQSFGAQERLFDSGFYLFQFPFYKIFDYGFVAAWHSYCLPDMSIHFKLWINEFRTSTRISRFTSNQRDNTV